MKKFLAVAILAGMGVAAAQAQANVRYFLSLEGLSNAGNTDSAAVAASNIGTDPTVDVGANPGAVTRLYLWADISASPNPTDLKGFTLGFQTSGNVNILSTNIWQNNFSLPGFARWNAAGFPGLQNWGGQSANPGTTVAVLEPGVTNGAFSTFDDQYIAGRALVGYVEVQGSLGDVQIVNVGSGFLQGSSTSNRVFLGFDDAAGAAAEVVGQPYNNASPEASIIPEPTSLALLGLAAVFGIRRR